MPYTKGAALASGPYTAGGTASNQQANNWETQYDEASQSLEQDLLTAFVFSGLTAAKDGVTANKLNLASGVAFPLQTDNTLRRRSISAQSFTTSTINTTYYLDLNPDGTLSWATAHSATANYLPLCSVTTDGSGNILAVTDARTTATTLLSGMVGTPTLPNGMWVGNGATSTTTDVGSVRYASGKGLVLAPANTGAAQGLLLQAWDGTTAINVLGIGTTTGATPLANVDSSGNLSAASLKEGTVRVAVQGTHSAGQPKISYGSGVPASLDANEIYFQIS